MAVRRAGIVVRIGGWAVASALAGTALPTLAQTIPGTSREELQRAAPPQARTAPGTARVDASAADLAGSCPDAILNSELTAPLTGIDFAGVRDAANPDGAPLAPAIAAILADLAKGTAAMPLDGTPRPIRSVCALRDAAEAALRRARYIAKVQVPPQTIGSGRLALTVVTARIVDLRVRGDAGRSRSRLEPILEELRGLDPLNEADAERVLLLARDIPGANVTLVLRSADSGRPGDVIGEIALDTVPGALFVNVQNTGSEAIGRFGGLVRGELYGLTGLADRTALGFYSTADFKEQYVVQASHDFAIGPPGLRIALSGAYAWTRPSLGEVGQGFDLRSRSFVGSLAASYPLIRSVPVNILVGGGLEFVNQRSSASGTDVNLDKLRVLFVRADAGLVERSGSLAPRGAMSASLELRKGVGFLGASKVGGAGAGVGPSRFDGIPTAFVARGRLGGEGRIRFGADQTRAVTLAVEGRGQWTKDPLFAFEEFAVGNLTIGRGYDPGSTSADRALGYIVELRAGKPVPQSVTGLAFEVIGFAEEVRIWNLDRQTTETDRSLRSYGGGIRATWGNRARLDLIYAHPVDKALTTDDRRPPDRLLVTFTVKAWPW